MKRAVVSACLAAGVSCGLALGVPVASAQIAPAARTASDLTPYRAQIGQAVAGYAERMQEGDLVAAADARKQLLAELQGFQVSPAFLEEVAREANRALLPVIRDNDDPTRRLNAAIAVAEIAEASRSLRLLPAVEAAMADESKPVQLWGVRGSRHLMARSLSEPNGTLHRTVLQIAEENINEGLLVGEAFRALTVNQTDRLLAAGSRKDEVLQGLRSLMRKRIDLYSVEPGPDLPEIDWLPPAYLVSVQVWEQFNPEERSEVIQLTVDLIDAALTRMQMVKQVEQGPYAQVIRKMGESLGAVAFSENISVLAAPAVSLAQIPLRPPQISSTRARVDAVFGAIGQVWEDVELP
ncbi:MAG: hypothetical protein ACFCVE_03785 [Phycisphaerae bacterium]